MIKRCWPVLVSVGLLAALPTAADTADIVASAPGRVEGANDIIPIGAAVTGVIERLFVTKRGTASKPARSCFRSIARSSKPRSTNARRKWKPPIWL